MAAAFRAKAVEHGTAVKQGDLVLALDTEKIDRTITELRSELKINELAVKQSEAQLAALDKVAPLDSDATNRAERIAKEDHKLYQEVEKPLAVKENEFRLRRPASNWNMPKKSTGSWKRCTRPTTCRRRRRRSCSASRRTVSIGAKSCRWSFPRHSMMLAKKLSLPRQDEAREGTDGAGVDRGRYLPRPGIPLAMSKHRLELDQGSCKSRSQGEDKLKKLIADREAITVKAPIDGIVDDGRWSRGKWAAMSARDAFRRAAQSSPTKSS